MHMARRQRTQTPAEQPTPAPAAAPAVEPTLAETRAAERAAARAERQTARAAAAAAREAARAPQPCLCGCGVLAGRGARFIPGHDARMHSRARRVAFGQMPAAEAEAGLDARCLEAFRDVVAHVDISTRPRSATRWVVDLTDLVGEDWVTIHSSTPFTTERQAADMASAINGGTPADQRTRLVAMVRMV